MRTASELAGMIAHVIREGLEGLVLKGVHTVYEPGKRHWLKVKKDYLQGGAMADSADLVVLGGYLGKQFFDLACSLKLGILRFSYLKEFGVKLSKLWTVLPIQKYILCFRTPLPGTGNKGGMCSVFLMGCYCTASNTWKTVCKVGNGYAVYIIRSELFISLDLSCYVKSFLI